MLSHSAMAPMVDVVDAVDAVDRVDVVDGVDGVDGVDAVDAVDNHPSSLVVGLPPSTPRATRYALSREPERGTRFLHPLPTPPRCSG